MSDADCLNVTHWGSVCFTPCSQSHVTLTQQRSGRVPGSAGHFPLPCSPSSVNKHRFLLPLHIGGPKHGLTLDSFTGCKRSRSLGPPPQAQAAPHTSYTRISGGRAQALGFLKAPSSNSDGHPRLRTTVLGRSPNATESNLHLIPVWS